ncbi:MAG: SMP-30/gluconolactonase/LRE family protein [Bryobacterales bacterium]|nr:SMP-30/gluconolactonase/LRE family protein [Bryobacterales bacterium]
MIPLLFFISVSLSFAQPPSFSIDTVAGSDPASSPAGTLLDVRGIAIGPSGTIFFSDAARHQVFRIPASGEITLLAGTGSPGFSGDGGDAVSAALNQPYGLAADAAGNVYIADLRNARVRRVDAKGRITTVAGGGALAVGVIPTPAVAASLKAPRNLSLDSAGNLYISDFLDHRVLRLGADGNLTAVAGNGTAGPAADSTGALAGSLAYPAGIFLDSAGVLYIADSGNHAIRIAAAGLMTTVRVQDASSFLNLPVSVCADASRNLYAVSSGFDEAVRITPAGAATVLARDARDLACDASGNLLIASGTSIRRLSPPGMLSTVAGARGQFRGEGVPATEALLHGPSDVQVDSTGALLITDTRNHRLRRVSAGIISTIAGNGEAGTEFLSNPQAAAIGHDGSIYIADTGNHRVRRLSPDGRLTTVAGTGVAGFNGEAGDALRIQLSFPSGVAVDPSGQLHIADTGNHRIRRLMPNGSLVTVAGTGRKSFSGDGLGGLLASFDTPRGICFDKGGNLYIADSGNHRIRKMAPSGIVTTAAGDGRISELNLPSGVAASDSALYISDTGNHRIRVLSAGGELETIAGVGTAGFDGDTGPALAAHLDEPAGISLDASGNVYVADRANHRIRKLTPAATSTGVPPAELSAVRVSSAATLDSTAIAPGMLVTIQGASVGPASPSSGLVGPTGLLETTLGGTEVFFDGKAAPILYAQDNLINAQAPYQIKGQTSLIEIRRAGAAIARATVKLAAVAPGIFTSAGGSGPATAFNEDYTINTSANPAPRGSLVTFYATGEGLTDPAGTDGKLAASPYPVPLAPVKVTIAGEPAELAALASGATSPGVLQVTARVPAQAAPGAQSLVLTVGGTASQANVTLFLR